jgi:hypothetical protein
MRFAFVAAVGLSLVAASSCGDGGSPDTTSTTADGAVVRRLTAAEQALVRRSERDVQRYCGRLALAAIGQGRPPSAEEQRRAFAGTDSLIELARRKPVARVESGADLGLFLGDLAEDIEGGNCDQRLVERIDLALATLPQPQP